MENRIRKKRNIMLYSFYAYLICVIIYFFITVFILKKDITEYHLIEKLVLLSGPIAQSIATARKKLYYATVFWIVFGLIGVIVFFFI